MSQVSSERQQWVVRLEGSNGMGPGQEQTKTVLWQGDAVSEDEAIGKALRANGLNGGWFIAGWWQLDV